MQQRSGCQRISLNAATMPLKRFRRRELSKNALSSANQILFYFDRHTRSFCYSLNARHFFRICSLKIAVLVRPRLHFTQRNEERRCSSGPLSGPEAFLTFISIAASARYFPHTLSPPASPAPALDTS